MLGELGMRNLFAKGGMMLKVCHFVPRCIELLSLYDTPHTESRVRDVEVGAGTYMTLFKSLLSTHRNISHQETARRPPQRLSQTGRDGRILETALPSCHTRVAY